jgi:hypothetical protein
MNSHGAAAKANISQGNTAKCKRRQPGKGRRQIHHQTVIGKPTH